MSRPLRAWLFVPGNRPERYAKALGSGADAVIIDLEDAVAPDAKNVAEVALASSYELLRGFRRSDVDCAIVDEAVDGARAPIPSVGAASAALAVARTARSAAEAAPTGLRSVTHWPGRPFGRSRIGLQH